jgi:hypothetical protein
VEFHHQGSVIAENKNAQNNALCLFSFSLTRKNRKKTECGNPTTSFFFVVMCVSREREKKVSRGTRTQGDHGQNRPGQEQRRTEINQPTM